MLICTRRGMLYLQVHRRVRFGYPNPCSWGLAQ